MAEKKREERNSYVSKTPSSPSIVQSSLNFSAKVLELQFQQNAKISIMAHHGYLLSASVHGELFWSNDVVGPMEVSRSYRSSVFNLLFLSLFHSAKNIPSSRLTTFPSNRFGPLKKGIQT